MAKYSIIIPVYNAANFISRCLDSAINQNFDDYEIIIVNDGSTDNSESIINSYKNNKIKYFHKKNGGVSDARNYGISKVSSEYFLFLDADDYIETNLLSSVNKVINKDIDVLSFNMTIVSNDAIMITKKPVFNSLDGEAAILEFINKNELFDTPCGYVYKTSYFKKNNFVYQVNRVHEDFGLTPLIILNANNVKSIEKSLYYYIKNDNSITMSVANTKKRAWDMLFHFDFLFDSIKKGNYQKNTKKIFLSFIANALINKADTLKGIDLDNYVDEINKRNVSKLLIANNLPRLIKKAIIRTNLKVYLKLSRR